MLVRLTFAAWRMVVSLTSVEGPAAENRRLAALLGKKKDSVWSQNKEDLIETARAELGTTIAMAGEETVITLREKIRRQRDRARLEADPLMAFPKGLEATKADDLATECVRRGLDISPLARTAGRSQDASSDDSAHPRGREAEEFRLSGSGTDDGSEAEAEFFSCTAGGMDG